MMEKEEYLLEKITSSYITLLILYYYTNTLFLIIFWYLFYFRLVSCSRWAEVTDAIRFHAGLAEAVGVPTEFRLLNGAPPLILGRGTDDGIAHKTLLEYLERSPG